MLYIPTLNAFCIKCQKNMLTTTLYFFENSDISNLF